jgi:palmitoyltransferase
MSSGNSSETYTNGSAATLGSSPPSALSGKSRAIPPKVTREAASVELKAMNSERGAVKGSIPLGEDIMQIARIGEISAMQRLFDEKKFSVNHKDEEGITPLHVRINLSSLAPILATITNLVASVISSGLRSTTSMLCASSY